MSEIRKKGKRATKGQMEIAREARQEAKKEDPKELSRYLSVIDDLAKLTNPNKYPEINADESIKLISCYEGFDDYEKSELWGLASSPYWREQIPPGKLDSIKERIESTYANWEVWIKNSRYRDSFIEFLNLLNPATISSLQNIIEDFQSPDQIIVQNLLEEAFDPEKYSKYDIYNLETLREFEPKQYQKLAKDLRNHYLNLADLIVKHAPIEKTDKWPRKWMVSNKAIQSNLNTKKPFIPILNYITNHAFHRTQGYTTYMPQYTRDDGKKFPYIVVKINTNRIANDIDISSDTVKLYIRAMKKAGFIKALTNPYYAIGYWDNRVRRFFLKKTDENMEILATFKLR